MWDSLTPASWKAARRSISSHKDLGDNLRFFTILCYLEYHSTTGCIVQAGVAALAVLEDFDKAILRPNVLRSKVLGEL